MCSISIFVNEIWIISDKILSDKYLNLWKFSLVSSLPVHSTAMVWNQSWVEWLPLILWCLYLIFQYLVPHVYFHLSFKWNLSSFSSPLSQSTISVWNQSWVELLPCTGATVIIGSRKCQQLKWVFLVISGWPEHCPVSISSPQPVFETNPGWSCSTLKPLLLHWLTRIFSSSGRYS